MNHFDNVRSNLKQVGTAFIILGLLDICAMVYCIKNSISYASCFNFIAGIFLYRGGPKTVSIVTFFCAFGLSGLFLGFLLILLISPFDLLWLHVKLEPANYLVSFLIFILILGLLFWTYKRLTRSEVLEYIKVTTLKPISRFRTPRAGFLNGIALVIFLGLAFRSDGKKGN